MDNKVIILVIIIGLLGIGGWYLLQEKENLDKARLFGDTLTITKNSEYGPFSPQYSSATCLVDGAVELQWTDKNTSVESFRIYRNIYREEEEINELERIGDVLRTSGQEAIIFVDQSAQKGILYGYAIKAVDNSGSSHLYSLLMLPQACE